MSTATDGDRSNGDGPVRQRPDHLARFEASVAAASAGYLEVAGWSQVADHAGQHGRVVALAPSLASTHPQLRTALEDIGVRVVVPDGDDPAAEVADVPVAVVRAELGIAETGSLLISEHELGDRVVTMLCHRLIQVVELDDVVERLESAATWMADRRGQPGFASLMTGPSRTADIERRLTIGVQGPDEVDVLVLTGEDDA